MSLTPHLGLAKPPDGSTSWGNDYRAAMDKIDSSAVRGAAFFVPGTLSAGALQGGFVAPSALRILGVRATVGSAPAGADILVDIRRNGSSIYTDQSQRPRIVAGAINATVTIPAITAINAGDVITLDIVQVGSTTPGETLMVTVTVVGV